MIVEWYFLVSLMTGSFNPATELGWAEIQHYDFSAPSLVACEVLREGTRSDFVKRMQGGDGLVITGCQPREPTPPNQRIQFP